MGKRRAGCFAKFVFLVSHDCFVALPYGAMGLSAVCECGISLSYSLFLYLSISNDIVSTKIYDKSDEFDFEIVYFLF